MNNQYTQQHKPLLNGKQFRALPYEQQRELMSYWRQNYRSKQIRQALGYNNTTTFYNVLKRLNLPTNLARNEQDNYYQTGNTEEAVPENDVTLKNNMPQKNLGNETQYNFYVELNGEVGLDDLPQILEMAQSQGLTLKIEQQSQPK